MAGNRFGCFFLLFQVDADDRFVVGASTDSTVCVWDRGTGQLLDTLYHHRASVWGLRLEGGIAFTGSMDGTVAIVEVEEGRRLARHFVAHESEWGVSDLDTTPTRLVTGCFGGQIKIWSLEDEIDSSSNIREPLPLLHTLSAGHAVNCVCACAEARLAASCSRTGRRDGGEAAANVGLWDMDTGEEVRRLREMNSSCFVHVDLDRLLVLSSAGSDIVGEHHLVKWPIAVLTIVAMPGERNITEALKSHKWNEGNRKKSELLLRYRRTPAVACGGGGTLLAYSQDRTPGMVTVVDFWPCR